MYCSCLEISHTRRIVTHTHTQARGLTLFFKNNRGRGPTKRKNRDVDDDEIEVESSSSKQEVQMNAAAAAHDLEQYFGSEHSTAMPRSVSEARRNTTVTSSLNSLLRQKRPKRDHLGVKKTVHEDRIARSKAASSLADDWMKSAETTKSENREPNVKSRDLTSAGDYLKTAKSYLRKELFSKFKSFLKRFKKNMPKQKSDRDAYMKIFFRDVLSVFCELERGSQKRATLLRGFLTFVPRRHRDEWSSLVKKNL